MDAPAKPQPSLLDADRPLGVVGTFSRGIQRAPEVASILGARELRLRPPAAEARELDCVVGWGDKSNTKAARDYARAHGLPYLWLEDGFLRSVGLGVDGAEALSLVVDDRGIYYDATRPSRLEALLSGTDDDALLDDAALLARARACIARIVEHELSKYNDSPPDAPPLAIEGDAETVLVVDQTSGDLSVERGLLQPGGFDAMLAAALSENPGARVLVKTHPDVLAGKKRGYLTDAGGDRVERLAAPHNPIALLERVDRVYVATSQLGFEALLVGKPVTCFGAPFYAGWGLTDDRVPIERRGIERSLPQVFAAAYLLYARYRDPDTGERCEIERVIDHLALQRRRFAENRGRLYCLGFTRWKHNHARAYLRCPGNEVRFVKSARHAERLGFDADARLLVWGRRNRSDVERLERAHGVRAERMEDGFLRSVGLGSDLTAPASLVLDRRGLYYDPHAPSDLEHLLQNAELDAAELSRARSLRDAIVRSRLSKYNVGAGQAVAAHARPGAMVVLVPGQVEDDASVTLGCLDVKTNAALLSAAREARPDAHLIYKPHPDVVSGNRRGDVDPRTLELADEVVEEATLADCLDAADEVHTMTSLVGFEALLRDKAVVTYGRPFYAGWGLTTDRHPIDRRTRRLSLDELLAGTLLCYPRYVNPVTGAFTTPEGVLSLLERERARRGGAMPVRRTRASRLWLKLVHTFRAMVPHAR